MLSKDEKTLHEPQITKTNIPNYHVWKHAQLPCLDDYVAAVSLAI